VAAAVVAIVHCGASANEAADILRRERDTGLDVFASWKRK
jgi:hypothetical protein